MADIKGLWHKVHMRCDYCGRPNPHKMTYVVKSEQVSGKFCSERHAKDAWKEMKKEDAGA